MDAASIRVTAETLKDFPGKVVRIIGKATSVDISADSATLDAEGAVTISTHGNEQLEVGKIYEVIGKASTMNASINSYSVLKLSDNVDLEMAQKFARMVPKVPELFYGAV
ncbi:replication factor A protein 3 [Metschnikowia bicuspidata]|uniref:Replication factor A protein 3 n=1 Tax=Metschnikowia bicuspidata TaxID=27322 RepID=A0A4P9ZIJ8_9ASCO|nr:replication factor A protein 3 [Metschnikowia bicuspidata]